MKFKLPSIAAASIAVSAFADCSLEANKIAMLQLQQKKQGTTTTVTTSTTVTTTATKTSRGT